MVNILNYAPFWRDEQPRGKDHEKVCTRESKLSGDSDEICPTGKAFDVILTGDYGDVSVRDIEED